MASEQKEPSLKKRKQDAAPLGGKVKFPLHAELAAHLIEYRKARQFDASDWVQKKCAMFNDYMKKSGLSAAVVSVSGGIDSSVTLGLMKHAMAMPGSPLKRILGISQPIHSSAWAFNRAKECCEAMGVPMVTIDQSKIHTDLVSLVDGALDVKGEPFAVGQLRSYQRTPVNYYVAQLLSQAGTPCVVMGTGNMDEDGYLAYFCKAGDGVVDVQLIADLHKSEVYKVGAELGVPDSTLVAAPSADLWDGQTDEDELGFSYDFIELFTGHYLKLGSPEQEAFRTSLSKEALDEFVAAATKCEAIHRRNKHKIDSPVNLNL